MNRTQSQIYDIIVVGGGPAGMMAAGRAAECGARVLLLEKNAKLGKKLLITGGGRCNITNAELDIRKMVAKYGPKGKALFGAFSRFGVAETLEFFHAHNLETKVEAEQRAFPKSNKAEDVWKTLVAYMRTGNVTVQLNAPVSEVLTSSSVIPEATSLRGLSGIHPKNPGSRLQGRDDNTAPTITGVRVGEKIYQANQFIIATGGKSRPETGSTGDGFVWMQEVGHTVDESKAALVPVITKEQWQKKLSGLSFAEAKLTVFQEGKKVQHKTGKLLFTHFGLSGPLVLNMSKALQDLFAYAPVNLFLDIYPQLDVVALDKKILDVFNLAPNKKIRNNLGEIVPPKMILPLLELCGIDPEKECNVVTKPERIRLVQQLKNLQLTLTGFLGVDKAITTSGGVNLTEIDFKTAQSKLFSNLYLVGDMLDFDRPSGGFSLQICWTTGYLAGEAAAKVQLA